MKATLEDGTDFRPPQQDDPAAATVTQLPVIGGYMNPADALSPPGYLGTRDEIEKELDLIAAAIRVFHRKQPDQVMRECSGYTARLTEMAVLLHRVEASSRHYTRIRTQQVERFIAELDRQFKTASRLLEVQKLDFATIRGQI
jgi:hypothetical protein